MDCRENSAKGMSTIAPGSPEEAYYAERGYIIVGGRPVCGVCFVGYGAVHQNWCPYGPGAK